MISVRSSITIRVDIDLRVEAAWQLIGLCAWVVKFTETLLKAAVLCNSSEIEKLLLGAQGKDSNQ